MSARDGLIAILTLVLGLAASTGAAWTTGYPLPVQAEAHGFDALAHCMFDGVAGRTGSSHRQQGAE